MAPDPRSYPTPRHSIRCPIDRPRLTRHGSSQRNGPHCRGSADACPVEVVATPVANCTMFDETDARTPSCSYSGAVSSALAKGQS